MKNQFLYLDTCATCKRIESDLSLPESVTRHNLRTHKITDELVEFLRKQYKSYEDLFNKRSQEYRKQGLHEKNLTEDDFKSLLTEHYSFIKRPILIYDDKAYVGNSKKVIAAAQKAVNP